MCRDHDTAVGNTEVAVNNVGVATREIVANTWDAFYYLLQMSMQKVLALDVPCHMRTARTLLLKGNPKLRSTLPWLDNTILVTLVLYTMLPMYCHGLCKLTKACCVPVALQKDRPFTLSSLICTIEACVYTATCADMHTVALIPDTYSSRGLHRKHCSNAVRKPRSEAGYNGLPVNMLCIAITAQA